MTGPSEHEVAPRGLALLLLGALAAGDHLADALDRGLPPASHPPVTDPGGVAVLAVLGLLATSCHLKATLEAVAPSLSPPEQPHVAAGLLR